MKKYIYAVVYFLTSLVLGADVNDIIEHIQETYDELDYLSATFRQTDTFRLTGSKSETLGKIYIKDGEKYRFESEDQAVVTDGETVWTYNSMSKQLLIDRVRKKSGALLPRDLLFKYPKTHHATLLKEEKIKGQTFYVLRLDPKEGVRGFIKSIKIRVREENWLIEEIETTDQNGNSSRFLITEIDTRTKLPDTLFSYQAPEGAQVVDMRK